MSCKAAIYTANTSAQTVADGGTIALGSIVRRFGNVCHQPIIDLSGTGVNIMEAGYYDVDASITAIPDAAGTVTATLFQDGVEVPGATASATVAAAATSVNLSVSALVRKMCSIGASTLTIVLTGAASSLTNVALVVERI